MNDEPAIGNVVIGLLVLAGLAAFPVWIVGRGLWRRLRVLGRKKGPTRHSIVIEAKNGVFMFPRTEPSSPPLVHDDVNGLQVIEQLPGEEFESCHLRTARKCAGCGDTSTIELIDPSVHPPTSLFPAELRDAFDRIMKPRKYPNEDGYVEGLCSSCRRPYRVVYSSYEARMAVYHTIIEQILTGPLDTPESSDDR